MARTAFLETEDLRDLWDHRENRERMGLTEFQAVNKMYSGVRELIRMESEL